MIHSSENKQASIHNGLKNENAIFEYAQKVRNYNDFQMKTRSFIKDIDLSVSSLLKSVLEENTIDYINIKDLPCKLNESPTCDTLQPLQSYDYLLKLKILHKLLKELSVHIVPNTAQTGLSQNEKPTLTVEQNVVPDCPSEKYSFIADLVDTLKETPLLKSKSALETLLFSIGQISQTCTGCSKLCYTSLFAVRKILLLLSLDDVTPQELRLVEQVIHQLNQLPIPCKDCLSYWRSSHDIDKSTNIESVPKLNIVSKTDSLINSNRNSTTSSCDIQDIPHKHKPKIELDISNQAAFYKLTGTQNSKTRDSKESYGFIKERKCPHKMDKETTISNTLKSKQFGEFKNSCQLQKNDCIDKPNIVNRKWKSNDTVSKVLKRILKDIPSSCPKLDIPEYDPFPGCSSTQNDFKHKNRTEYIASESLFDSKVNCKLSQQGTITSDYSSLLNDSKEESDLKSHPEIRDVLLNADSKGNYGLELGYSSMTQDSRHRVLIVTDIQRKSPAYKTGLLKKGDRILALNGRSTVGISSRKLEALKNEVFAFDHVVLRVEFDVKDVDVQWGTFSVDLENSATLGLVMDESRNNRFVKGIVKGSVVHRCGEVFPNDELLSLTRLSENKLNLQDWKTKDHKTYQLVIRRNSVGSSEESDGSCQTSPPTVTTSVGNGTDFTVKRTTIHTIENSKNIVLEQEFTLYRDPITWDFGFKLGENPKTGKAYVVDVKPGGPAHHSKLIRKNDRIVEVNGILVDGRSENSVMTLLMQTAEHLDMRTRRVLIHK